MGIEGSRQGHLPCPSRQAHHVLTVRRRRGIGDGDGDSHPPNGQIPIICVQSTRIHATIIMMMQRTPYSYPRLLPNSSIVRPSYQLLGLILNDTCCQGRFFCNYTCQHLIEDVQISLLRRIIREFTMGYSVYYTVMSCSGTYLLYKNVLTVDVCQYPVPPTPSLL